MSQHMSQILLHIVYLLYSIYILLHIQNMKKTLFGLALASAALIGSTFASDNTLSGTGIIVGGDTDAHGCKGSAWYVWSESAQQCVRPWEQDGSGKKEEIKNIREKAKEEIKTNRQAAKTDKKEYRDAFHADYGYIRNYFTKLTDKTARAERQTTVDAAVKTLLAEKNKLNTEYRTSVKNKTPMTAEAVKARVDAMINTFYNAVSKYVDPAKKESFDSFVAGKSTLYNQIFTVNQLTLEKNQQVKTETKAAVAEVKATTKATKETAKKNAEKIKEANKKARENGKKSSK